MAMATELGRDQVVHLIARIDVAACEPVKARAIAD